MRNRRCIAAALPLLLAVMASGCGTPKEKTAPCKRPANLTSYVATNECGPMVSIHSNPAAALAAIQGLAPSDEE